MRRSTSIRPGTEWLDTDGRPIQAHGGSLIFENSTYYWYGENKEFTTGETDVWHWGIRCYSSRDLYNWEDLGLIVPPRPESPESSLHPSRHVDRPHIIFDPASARYVCWLKVMGSGQSSDQTATVMVSDALLGPYEIEAEWLSPHGMGIGDFDIASREGRGHILFERPHSELICADLSADLRRVEGKFSRHFQGREVPDVREAPAMFERGGSQYLITSGTSGYFPNRSEVAVADEVHGPWRTLGDLHPSDASGTSFRSQISSVFRHPEKQDLFIALADRWLPRRNETESDLGEFFRRYFADPEDPALDQLARLAGADLEHANTSLARYVWLPIQFDGERPFIGWVDEWRIEDFD